MMHNVNLYSKNKHIPQSCVPLFGVVNLHGFHFKQIFGHGYPNKGFFYTDDQTLILMFEI